jgi:hypothetical protein
MDFRKEHWIDCTSMIVRYGVFCNQSQLYMAASILCMVWLLLCKQSQLCSILCSILEAWVMILKLGESKKYSMVLGWAVYCPWAGRSRPHWVTNPGLYFIFWNLQCSIYLSWPFKQCAVQDTVAISAAWKKAWSWNTTSNKIDLKYRRRISLDNEDKYIPPGLKGTPFVITSVDMAHHSLYIVWTRLFLKTYTN